MAKINATDYLLYIDGNIVGSLQSVSISINNEIIDTTTKDSGGFEEHIAGGGLRGAEISFNGLEDPTNTVDIEALYTEISARTGFAFRISTTDTAKYQWTGNGTLTSLEQEYPTEDAVTYSGTIKVNGTLTRELTP